MALLISGCGTAASPRTPAPAQKVDLAVVGADIHTMDPARPRAQAVAIAGGTIVAVGTDAEIRALGAARVIDAKGATVTPGLIDAHCHLYGLGVDRDSV
ncbi:MAG: amidohydrolase family protein, partial [Myxococcales bacterium]|nr:amidohydrolase family protein [Myxococcales bacterium]